MFGAFFIYTWKQLKGAISNKTQSFNDLEVSMEISMLVLGAALDEAQGGGQRLY